jgi:outer membrane protein
VRLFPLVAALLATVAPLAAQGETLEDALIAAYGSNPTLAAERAALRATDEDVAAAKSGYRPNISSDASVSEGFIDRDGTTFSTGIAANQSIWRGGRTQNGVAAAELGVKVGRERLRSVENSVFFDTVSAYMNVLRDQSVLSLNDNQVRVLERQLQATNDRFRVGEITKTDVAQSEARLSRARTDQISAIGSLTTSREFYRRVVGQLPGTLETPSTLSALPGSVDEAVDVAIRNSPTVLAARFAEQAAGKQVAAAKGAVLPSVGASVGVNYVDQPPVFAAGARSKVTAGSIGGSVSIPLFQSGAEYAAVRRAQAQRSQRMVEIAEAERRATEQVRSAWAILETARSSIVSAQSQVRANEIALEGVKQEQTVGTRTILDVLNAEQELLDSRVTLVRAQRDELVAANGVQAAIGALDAKSLALKVDAYDPDVHYRASKDRWFGWNPEN